MIIVDGMAIGPKDCSVFTDLIAKDRMELSYEYPSFEIKVAYQIGPAGHYIEKRLQINHRGDKPFTLERVSLGSWEHQDASGTLVPFQHGQCLTYFLRRPDSGYFFGVRAPFADARQEGAARIDLAYPVRMVFSAGSTYDAEPAFWGVYQPTGRFAPPAPPLIEESVQSQILPDLGESEAMLRMVRDLAPPRGGITLIYNGYQGGLYLGDYGEPEGMARAEEDIETLRIVKDMLGPCIVQPAAPFFGAHDEAMALTARDENLSEPPGRRKLVDWINANGMQSMNWASLKAVHGWRRPKLGPFCPDRPDWQATDRLNCTANPEFMKWIGNVILNDCRSGFSGFISDEPGPGMRYAMDCDKAGHLHLPGDASYAYFYQRREIFRKLRAAFGPEFELQGQRPHMDTGIWDATYLNTIFTFVEDAGVTPVAIRQNSRLRRAYSFVPSYMDQILVQPGLEPVDVTMLSALAASSNFLFIAPTSPERLKEHIDATTRDNSVMRKALREFPEQDRKRMRFWLDWARDHADFMNDVIDLPGWPGQGAPDGYLRIHEGRGFAFLFNPGDSAQATTVPLDASVGLDESVEYTLQPVHAPEGEAMAGRGEAILQLPSRAAWLLSITKAADRAK